MELWCLDGNLSSVLAMRDVAFGPEMENSAFSMAGFL